jgi:glycolate oxidase FAD binding subunit
VRDFLIGVRFVDGRGILVRGGGNVVKNAAGFDYPKLMVGGLGRLGVITEVTFKVFPAPKELATVEASYRNVEGAVNALVKLSRSRFTMEALDLVPTSGGASLLIRLGGLPTALGDRVARITSYLFEEGGAEQISPAFPEEGVEYWRETASMSWVPDDHLLAKVPVTPRKIREADPVWASQGAIRRYVAGGQNAWLAWPASRKGLDASLQTFGLPGVILRGNSGRSPWVGALQGEGFLKRIAAALDPDNRFGALDLWL